MKWKFVDVFVCPYISFSLKNIFKTKSTLIVYISSAVIPLLQLLLRRKYLHKFSVLYYVFHYWVPREKNDGDDAGRN